MNSQLQYRGSLPAPPIEALVFDDGIPPPCPREMYSQGVYDVIPGDPHHHHSKKHKPAAPQRSPSTRLTSQTSHDEGFIDQHSPRQPISPRQPSQHATHGHVAHQQQVLRQQPGSPGMKQRNMSHPDSSQSKPFSYFGNNPAPQQRHSEGMIQYVSDVSPNGSNYEEVNQYNYYQNGRSEVMISAKQTSYEYPPNYGEPHGHVAQQGSPVLQRQSLTRKASLSPVMKRRNESPKNGNPKLSQGQRGPPSFPAPSVAPGHVRTTSPQLPPQQGGYDQPPPPPPIEKIPGHHSVSSFEIGKKKRQSGESDMHGYHHDQHVGHPPRQASVDGYMPGQQAYGQPFQQGYGPPLPQHYQQSPQMSSNIPCAPVVPIMVGQAPALPARGGLSEQLNKVKLKTAKSGSIDGISAEERKANELAAELGKVKLKAVKSKAAQQQAPDQAQDIMPAVILPKLKSTGAKPWEKDTTPEPQSEQDNGEEQFDGDYFPPPPPDLELPPLDQQPVNTAQPTVNVKPQKKKGISEPSLSNMDDIQIDLSSIDYNQIPGYTPITAAVPNWKRDMIEKKNQEKLEEYIEYLKRRELQLRRQKAEEEKWKNVPAWKRKILMEKAAVKTEQDEQFAIDEARRQKEKKERTFQSPDQVKLKPVKPKSETQPTENTVEPPTPEPIREDPKPLQEIRNNIPNSQPETLKSNQTKNIPPVLEVKTSPPVPQKEKPVQKVPAYVPEPDLPPPPPLDDLDDPSQQEEMRRREEKRRQIEAEANEEESGDLPAWKKEIMMKRGGVLKNWGDEREDINEAE